jgi:hypothetical protein
MKEIDFIPQWYKDGQKHHVGYHTQCVVIICIFAVIVLWSFGTSYSVSRAKAQMGRIQESLAANADLAAEYNQLGSTMAQLRQKTETLEKLNHKTNIANVVAEFSFLITDNITLSKLDIYLESFQPGSATANKSSIRLGSRSTNAPSAMPETNNRFRVVITGIAAGAQDVAALISRLEDSPYFCQIIPGFSRSKKIKELTATEFEISCYLANYVEQK